MEMSELATTFNKICLKDKAEKQKEIILLVEKLRPYFEFMQSCRYTVVLGDKTVNRLISLTT